MPPTLKGIKEVCSLTGVTRRTLQHYDAIGLLSCTEKGKNNAWLYDDKAIRRLREILFLQECDLKLSEIKVIMDLPEKEKIKVFAEQLEVLKEKRSHLDEVITFVEQITEDNYKAVFKPLIENINLPEALKTSFDFEEDENLFDTTGSRILDLLSSLDEPAIEKLEHTLSDFDLVRGKPSLSEEGINVVSDFWKCFIDFNPKLTKVDLYVIGIMMSGNPLEFLKVLHTDKELLQDLSGAIIEYSMKELDHLDEDLSGWKMEETIEYWWNGFASAVAEIVGEDTLDEAVSGAEVFDPLDAGDPHIQAFVKSLDTALSKYTQLLDICGLWFIGVFLVKNPQLLGEGLMEDIDPDFASVVRLLDRAIRIYATAK